MSESFWSPRYSRPIYPPYKSNIILFSPIEGIQSAFIAQCVRLLYPCILDYREGVLVTDIDDIPMNSRYFVDNIRDIAPNKWVNYRDWGAHGNCPWEQNMVSICWQVASSATWRDVFGIQSLEDIQKWLSDVSASIAYDGKPGEEGWFTDQLCLWKALNQWAGISKDYIFLSDTTTGFRRLDRAHIDPRLTEEEKERIRQGHYSDYHCLRPYRQYKRTNREILRLLESQRATCKPPSGLCTSLASHGIYPS